MSSSPQVVHGLDIMRTFRQLFQSLVMMATDASPPYLSEYLPASGDVVAIDMKDYSGLAFYYVVQDGSLQQRVTAVWRSHAFYAMDGERLRAVLRAPPVLVHGFVARSTIRPKPFWQRWTKLNLVLTVATFLGALTSIRLAGQMAALTPSLTPKWDVHRTHLTEGEEFTAIMGLVPDLPVPHENVTVSGKWVAAEPSSTEPIPPLEFSPRVIKHMGVGEKNDIDISGVAPRHGRYTMVIDVSARAGLLAGTLNFPFTQKVTVWPRNPVGSLAVKSVEAGNAVLRGELHVGQAAPNGLQCELELRGADRLQYDKVFGFPGLRTEAEWTPSSDTLPNQIYLLQWTVLPVAERSVIVFRIALKREGMTDWERVAKRSKVHCYYSKEQAK